MDQVALIVYSFPVVGKNSDKKFYYITVNIDCNKGKI